MYGKVFIGKAQGCVRRGSDAGGDGNFVEGDGKCARGDGTKVGDTLRTGGVGCFSFFSIARGALLK